MKTYTTTKSDSWGSWSAWKKGNLRAPGQPRSQNVATLPSQVGNNHCICTNFPGNLRENFLLRIVHVLPSTHYNSCPKTSSASYLAIWPLRKILLLIDLHGEVFEIIISYIWYKQNYSNNFSPVINVTYRIECSKNSACLFERWKGQFQQQREGSYLGSPQGCTRRNIGIRKHTMVPQTNSKATLEKSTSGPSLIGSWPTWKF